MRPRLLLVPGFSELEWSIRPQLEEWAEVASFDLPGIGVEPPPPGGIATMTRADVAARGLAEVDKRGWESFFLLADGWGIGSAAVIVARRPSSIAGVALGHAVLAYRTGGDQPSVNPATYAAMSQLIAQDSPSFVRYGISQLTQGGYDDQLADQMVQRFQASDAHGDVLSQVWERMLETEISVVEALELIEGPMVLAKHEGCLLFTPEGFEEVAAAFPDAGTLSLDKTPCASEEFAVAIREAVLAPSDEGRIKS